MSTTRQFALIDLAPRLWRLLDAPQRQQCVLVVGLTIVAGWSTVIGVAGVAPFMAVLADPSVVSRSPVLTWLAGTLELESPRELVAALGVGFVVLLGLSNAANLLATLAIGRFSHGVGARLHVLLFEEYLHRDQRFHARHNSDVLAARVVHEVNRTVGGVIQGGLTLIASAVSVGLIVLAVAVVSPGVALSTALVLGATYAAVYALVRRRLVEEGTVTAVHWDARAKMLAESFEGVEDIRIFGAQSAASAQVAHHCEAIAAAQVRTSAIAIAPKYVLECVTAAALVGAALWVYSSAGSGAWLTQVAVLGLAAYRLLSPLQQAFHAVARIRSDGVGFERIADDLTSARQRRHGVSEVAKADWRGRPRRDIRFTEVSYRHCKERPGGVTDVSFAIPAGALVGLVGPNGSGKTTLANLLLGLLVPDAGRVEVDGRPLDELGRAAWWSTVGCVPQHIVLLDASVAENIALGVDPHDIDAGRLRDVIRAVGLEAVVNAMPDGWRTVVGQNGRELSGGQRQRLGIARALYRRASFLVLDEPASALDAATEAALVDRLVKGRGQQTAVLITHHAAVLRACDLVLELDEGRVTVCRPASARAAGIPARAAGTAPP